ncbi:MAG TPA: sugar phosphate isomerase/epimerase family protein [Candidatus Acidoferrales bacterium]|nr:sugar phosphate isomerase/epimerase family protein [Candidatus Acidoferrales bacterium]
MDTTVSRRGFVSGALGLAAAGPAAADRKVPRDAGTHYRIGLNAYSFNAPLRAGTMTLEDVVHYCAEHSIDAVDPTGYYFPGYPKVPSDEVIFRLKRTAHWNGVTLSGTGVRNDFAVADREARKRDVQMVKEWIEVAARLGAPVIRVFSGVQQPEGYSFDQVVEWMVADFRECAAHAARFGVILGLQNHNDFIKTAAQAIRIIDAVDSLWFGSILDIGSLRTNEVYGEIEKLVPYAVSWQLKEEVANGVRTDLRKVKAIIDRAGYRGFLPIETLGQGDPKVKVAEFVGQVRAVFSA